jgi:pimeloyl-ACP methyl ester carboxylesterase
LWVENGLEHRVLEWTLRTKHATTHADAAPPATAILLHGFQDSAATFDEVTVPLARAGLRVLAPDLRGFGDGARVPPGAYYYFPDYVADVAAIAHNRVTRGTPIFLIGHSMGANVASLLAGAYPELVTKLAILDSVGAPDNPHEVAPVRMRRWIESVDKLKSPLGEQGPMTLDDAVARYAKNNPDIDEATLRRFVPRLVREVPPERGGGVEWKFDRLHLSVSPVPFFAESFKAYLRRITGPVLYVSGGPTAFHVPDEEERLACIPRLTRRVIDGGHALHWTRPAELAAALIEFWQAE